MSGQQNIALESLLTGPPVMTLGFGSVLVADSIAESARLDALVLALRTELARRTEWRAPKRLELIFGDVGTDWSVGGDYAMARVKLTGHRRRMSDGALVRVVFEAILPYLARWFARRTLQAVFRRFVDDELSYLWRSPRVLSGSTQAWVELRLGMSEAAASLRVGALAFPLFLTAASHRYWLRRLGRLRSTNRRVWVEMVRGEMFVEEFKGRPSVFVTGRGESGVRRFAVDVAGPEPIVVEDWAAALAGGEGIAKWARRGWSARTGSPRTTASRSKTQ